MSIHDREFKKFASEHAKKKARTVDSLDTTVPTDSFAVKKQKNKDLKWVNYLLEDLKRSKEFENLSLEQMVKAFIVNNNIKDKTLCKYFQ